MEEGNPVYSFSLIWIAAAVTLPRNDTTETVDYYIHLTDKRIQTAEEICALPVVEKIFSTNQIGVKIS